MTNSKKIRLLNEYVDKGLGEQIVLKIEDRWGFDPDVLPIKYPVREQYSVSDALNQFKEQKGYIYEGINIKDLQKIIECNQPLIVKGEYQDTKKEFFEKHPNYFKELKEKWNRILGIGKINQYKSLFM